MSERVKDRIKDIGLSQAELSRRTGIIYPTLNSILNGRLRPTPAQCELIARELETTPEQLWPVLNQRGVQGMGCPQVRDQAPVGGVASLVDDAGTRIWRILETEEEHSDG
jgi:lambda repressor-like predicted transcriptional regulator